MLLAHELGRSVDRAFGTDACGHGHQVTAHQPHQPPQAGSYGNPAGGPYGSQNPYGGGVNPYGGGVPGVPGGPGGFGGEPAFEPQPPKPG